MIAVIFEVEPAPGALAEYLDLAAGLRAELEAYFAPEYDIYAHLRDTGTWTPPAGYVPAS